jgi:hypothetical protein
MTRRAAGAHPPPSGVYGLLTLVVMAVIVGVWPA